MEFERFKMYSTIKYIITCIQFLAGNFFEFTIVNAKVTDGLKCAKL